MEIQNGQFPDHLAWEIVEMQSRLFNNSTVFAVRSSGTLEDSADQTFAGQLHTALKIQMPDLFTAIKDCWASFYSERVVNYLKHNHLPTTALDGGVIIQEMIFPELSGVLFTQNPLNGHPNEIYLEIVAGACDGLVSGARTPAHLVIDKRTAKILQQQFTGEITPENLPHGIVGQLVADAQKIEKIFKTPQDIEWGYCDNQFFYFQTRPITTVLNRPAPKIIEWTNENVAEVIPDIVTPLTWSIVEPLANGGFFWFLKKIGISKYPPEGLFGLIKGKVYLNRTNFHQTLQRFYFRKRLVEFTSSGNRKKQGLIFFIRNGAQLIGSGFRIFMLISILPAKIRSFLQRHPDRLGKLEINSAQDVFELYRKCDEIFKLNQECMNLHIACTILAELYYQLLAKFLSELKLNTELVTVNNLLLGLNAAESAQSGVDLWKIAREISKDAQLRKSVLITSEGNFQEMLKQTKSGQKIIEMIDAFIDQYGHCALHEFELIFPRWREDLTYIYNNLKNYLNANIEVNPEDDQRIRNEKRHTVTQAAIASIHSGFKRLVFKYVLANARHYSVWRENLKQAFIKAHSLFKLHLTQLAPELVTLNKIKQADDIFFIRYPDIRDLILNPTQNGHLESEIQKNRSKRERFLKIKHPQNIKQIGEQYDFIADTFPNNQPFYRGTGCSDGKIIARARVILNPEHSHILEKGEILVAPSTNPGWTPLFVLAGGIITETGGVLSHGSIIAREYGIPLVTNIKNATCIFRTGDVITMDGNSGTVIIEKKQGINDKALRQFDFAEPD